MQAIFRIQSVRLLVVVCSFLWLWIYILPVAAAEASDGETLKFALLPILDAFPYHVAESRGYFKNFGVQVKAVPVVSGLERDQLMQSGEIDGMLNEMMTTANFNRDQAQVKIVMSARTAYCRPPAAACKRL